MTAPDGAVAATFFDGQSARRQEVLIIPAADRQSLEIRPVAGGGTILWPLDRLRALHDQSDSGRLTLALMAESGDESPRDPARLVVTDPKAVAWMLRTRPGLLRHDLRPGTFRKVALWAGGAITAMGLMLFVILPALSDYLARHLPVETEVAFGAAVMKQLQWLVSNGEAVDLDCSEAEGLAALDRMRDRLTGGRDLGYDLDLHVYDSGMVNAFAAPGGQIVIFRGLIDAAESADEVAGVLAHEIGHVVARDPTRLALRAAGSAGILSMLVGDVTGGTVVSLAGEQILNSAYTREAEAGADLFAFGLLNDAGVSSEPMARFFDRIAGAGPGMPEIMASHPASGGRASAARANAAAKTATTPILDEADWQALRGVCG